MEITTLFALGFVLLFIAVIIITFVEKKHNAQNSAYTARLEGRLEEAEKITDDIYKESKILSLKLGRAEKKIENMKRDHKLQLQRLRDPANQPGYDQSNF